MAQGDEQKRLGDVTVGERSILHSGAVLGSDGFGYVWNGRERVKVPQAGRLSIGANVEIGANTTIDRATAGSTIIGSVSADGNSWRTVGSTTLLIGSDAFIGLVVTSATSGTYNTSTFDNVSVTGQPTTTRTTA